MLVGLPALLEAEALSVHLQDMDMVGEAVEEGPGEPFRAEVFSPLVEGQVGGNPGPYTHLRAHETLRHLVCRLLLEKKKTKYRNPLITVY